MAGKKKFISAARTFPKCIKPVGDGAKRTRIVLLVINALSSGLKINIYLTAILEEYTIHCRKYHARCEGTSLLLNWLDNMAASSSIVQ